MERLKQTEDHDVWIARVERPYAFASPFGGSDFTLLLVASDASITDAEREFVCDEIIRQGCRYAVCWGHECALWDHSIDWSEMSRFPDFKSPDERFVMTTWHEDVPLEEAIENLRWATGFDDYDTERVLVLILGGDAIVEESVRSAVVNVY